MCLILVLKHIELEHHKLFSLVYLLLVLLPLMEAAVQAVILLTTVFA